jgi:hypothetical protein
VTRVEVVIDELVLVGFDPRDRHLLAAALRGELEGGLTATAVVALLDGSSGRSDRERMEVVAQTGADAPGAAGRRPDAIGRRVGAAVVGALGGAAPSPAGGRGS